MRKSVFYFSMVVLALLLVVLDQWTKLLATVHLKGREDIVLIQNVLQLHYLQNTGAAFSILEGKTVVFYIITPLLAIVIFAAFFRLPYEKRYLPLHFVCIFLVAGAVGNLIDRIRYGAVTDFIYFSLIDFPVFNVSDIYVTCSMAAAMLLILFYYKDEEIA